MGILDDLCDENQFSSLESLSLTGWQPCFEDVVLLAPVYTMTVLLCGFRAHKLRTAPAAQRDALDQWLSVVGGLGSVANLAASVLLLVVVEDLGTYEYIVGALGAASWAASLAVVVLEYGRSVPQGQWVLRFVWLWVFVASCVRMNTQTEMPAGDSIDRVLLFWIHFIGQAALVLASYFDKRPLLILSTMEVDDDEHGLELTSIHPTELKRVEEAGAEDMQLTKSAAKHPGQTASLPSRLTFWWMNRLVFWGYKNNLVDEDIWPLPARFEASNVSERFEAAWARESERAKRYKREPSLLNAFRATFGPRFYAAGPLLLVQNLSQLALPVVLGFLLEFLADDTRDVSEGYVLSALFFVSLMVMTIAENQYFDVVVKTGTEVRSALVTAVYRKALRMSNDARRGLSVGAIVQLQATDTDKLQMQTMVIHNCWSSPMRILLGVGLLIDGLGWAGVVGFICVLVLIPVQGRVMLAMQKLLKQVLKKSDLRIKLVNEILGGMRVIKFYAWENKFVQKINEIRNEELELLYASQIKRALVFFLMKANPVALSMGSFVAFALLDAEALSPEKAFMALALFQQLLWPLMMFPRTLASLAEAQVSLQRIEQFLVCDELNQEPRPNSGVPHIKIEDGTFRWESNQPTATLSNINLHVRTGELVAVIGTTGSGKSSLVSAMLGEIECSKGSAVTDGTVAFAAQQAWIFNATVRDNILFGLPFDEERYWNAVRVSNLETDINEQFAAGDMTEIGERGISLSGGQKQRLSIARAVYADADIVLFDDPLSALDAHVGADVFRECIVRHLANKTRVVVTNQTHLLPEFDRVVMLDHGAIACVGTYEELMSSNAVFNDLMREHGAQAGGSQEEEAKVADSGASSSAASVPTARERSKSAAEKTAKIIEEHKKDKHTAEAGRLTTAEKRATGSVKWWVYRTYVQAVGNSTFFLMLLCYVLGVGLNLGSSMWLAEWADKPLEREALEYAGIFAALSMGQVVMGLAANIVGFRGSVTASKVLHSRLMKALLAAPMYFFDMTPMGRIVNRFTKDMASIDTQLQFNLALLLSSVLDVVGTLVIIGINTPYVIVVAVPVIALFVWVQTFYRRTSVQLKRMDSVSRSPVYAHFSETLSGMSTIRAYDAQQRMADSNAFKLDQNQKIYLTALTSNRWLSIRLEFLGGILILCAAVNCVLLRESLSAAEAGVAMAYSLQITTLLNTLVRFVTEVEASFNAVERVDEYCQLKPEASRTDKAPPSAEWPAEGRVELTDLVMSYRPGLPAVMKGVSLVIEPQEKIGVVGRTGAGKSTLFQCLFRIAEATEGTVTFDGVNIRELGLDHVRNAVAIIPQDPVIFSGPLRFNLDPFDQHKDHQLWEALEKANLKDVVEAHGAGLGMVCAEGGENFSVGQRQLLCLARALLRKTKILVLDEATANVDVETDALIQQTIRENFADRTTLTIAHRLNTIIDCDRVLVMDLGRVAEYDTPANLLANPKSAFTSMVNETGEQNAQFLRRVALGEVNIAAEEAALAEAAAERIRHGLTTVSRGPLMRAVDEASETLVQGFVERHAPKWQRELEEAGVSPEIWLKHLTIVVNKITSAEHAACEEDGLDARAFRGEGQMDNFQSKYLFA